jgi:beta-lactamase class A
VGRRKIFWTGVIVGGLVAGLVFGVGQLSSSDSQRQADKYPLLAKRIFVEQPNDTLIHFSPLRAQIKQYLASMERGYSFYFEYLPTGVSVRAGDETEMVAASLMKIPAVMNLYRAHELGKLQLDDETTITPDLVNNDFPTSAQLRVGSKISLRKAAEIALVESDNTAVRIVIAAYSKVLPAGEEVLPSLDIQFDVQDKTRVLISAKAYASFLKCLYFSCFLNRDNSEQLLGYLSRSAYDKRIEAGIPADIKVAHKIGSFSTSSQSDCGIVYLPLRPYLLCMMVATGEKDADKHISTVAKMAHEYLVRVNP